jgi:hypothetical protein
MNRRVTLIAIVLTAGLCCAPPGFTAPGDQTQKEINYLLEAIGKSGCEFYRNGSWYSAERAQSHLKTKYDYMQARKQISTAEDFIDRAATKSSMSGETYRLRCAGSDPVPTRDWLMQSLQKYRDSPAALQSTTNSATSPPTAAR